MKHIELFKNGFDSTIDKKKQPENYPYVGHDIVTGEIVYTLVPEIDGVYYDITVLVKKSIPVPSEGYREVDLGLPSGIKWADRNVGAENPWDNGAYFSWGNVDGVVYSTMKMSENDLIEQLIIIMLGVEATPEQIEEVKNNPEIMSQINVIIPMLISGKIIPIIGTTFDEDTYPNTSGGQYIDSTLDAEHDAATVNMGNDWCMPTVDETNELIRNTDHYYIDLNGNIIAGPFNYETNYEDKGLDRSKLLSICFVKKGEAFDYGNRSNFIEIPFAGRCFYNSLSNNGSNGHVWSSSANGKINVWSLSFDYDGRIYSANSSDYPQYGLSVRGVLK